MKNKRMALCALFAAMTAVCAQIVLPMGVVPVNLALLPLLLSAALLPPRHAAASALLYLAMGLIGLPVFAGMTGGPGVLVGPTGGFLLGYIPCTWLTSYLRQKRLPLWFSMAAGLLTCYILGLVGLCALSHMSLPQALATGILPFIIGDVLKLALAAYLARRLTPVLR